MHIEERVTGDVGILSVSGDGLHDGCSADLVERVGRLLEFECRHIVINLEGVHNLEAAELGGLVQSLMAAGRDGDFLIVTNRMTVFERAPETDEISETRTETIH